jgi:hypothetical protein
MRVAGSGLGIVLLLKDCVGSNPLQRFAMLQMLNQH